MRIILKENGYHNYKIIVRSTSTIENHLCRPSNRKPKVLGQSVLSPRFMGGLEPFYQ